jgi:hypothetical protein
MTEKVLEFLTSVGGVGAILLVVLYGGYLLLRPLLTSHLALVDEMRKDIKADREKFNEHRLESQRVQIEMLQALRDLRESIKNEKEVVA